MSFNQWFLIGIATVALLIGVSLLFAAHRSIQRVRAERRRAHGLDQERAQGGRRRRPVGQAPACAGREHRAMKPSNLPTLPRRLLREPLHRHLQDWAIAVLAVVAWIVIVNFTN